MICIARRMARSSPRVERRQVRAVERRRCPAVGSIRRSTSRPSVDLPQPDSPTSAQRLARREREAHAVDRAHLRR